MPTALLQEDVSGGKEAKVESQSSPSSDEKVELQEDDAYDKLGYSYPTWRKWLILSVMFYIQISINLIASMYANAVPAISKKFGITFLILSSVGGSVVGAVVGGFVEAYAPLSWIFWVQLIAGGIAQLIHFLVVPETRATIILDREAKKRRKAGEKNVFGPNEIEGFNFSFKHIVTVWVRPFQMLFTEPIVAWLSALSGFSDALIFTFLQGFQLVYEQWGFGPVRISLAFIPLLIGYFLAYLSFLPSIHRFRKTRRREGPEAVEPEARLWWLRYMAPLLPIGLIGFAWTSLGPPRVHWIAPMIFTLVIGAANYSIYQSSIDYTVGAYGAYAASATGGNDFARDFLSGIAALYSTPMYSNIGTLHTEWASTILACVAVLVVAPIYYFYKNGPEIRQKSKFASKIAEEREERKKRSGGHSSEK